MLRCKRGEGTLSTRMPEKYQSGDCRSTQHTEVRGNSNGQRAQLRAHQLPYWSVDRGSSRLIVYGRTMQSFPYWRILQVSCVMSMTATAFRVSGGWWGGGFTIAVVLRSWQFYEYSKEGSKKKKKNPQKAPLKTTVLYDSSSLNHGLLATACGASRQLTKCLGLM